MWGNARRYQGKQGDAEVDKTRTLKEALKNRWASYFGPEVVSSFGNEIAFLKCICDLPGHLCPSLSRRSHVQQRKIEKEGGNGQANHFSSKNCSSIALSISMNDLWLVTFCDSDWMFNLSEKITSLEEYFLYSAHCYIFQRGQGTKTEAL